MIIKRDISTKDLKRHERNIKKNRKKGNTCSFDFLNHIFKEDFSFNLFLFLDGKSFENLLKRSYCSAICDFASNVRLFYFSDYYNKVN